MWCLKLLWRVRLAFRICFKIVPSFLCFLFTENIAVMHLHRIYRNKFLYCLIIQKCKHVPKLFAYLSPRQKGLGGSYQPGLRAIFISLSLQLEPHSEGQQPSAQVSFPWPSWKVNSLLGRDLEKDERMHKEKLMRECICIFFCCMLSY